MFSKPEEVLEFIKNEDVKFVDVRFCDLPGVMQHFNVPAVSLTLDFFTEGQMFDGSSIRGFQAIHESDMKLLKSTGIADMAYFGAEPEFYIFDDVRYETRQNASYYCIDSIEAAWNTGREEEGGNQGYKTRYKGGYFPVPPVDHFADMRDEMCLKLADVGLTVERSHHEVGTAGQQEINYRFGSLLQSGDDVMKFKYVIKNVAWAGGKTATFMPKPIFGDNGSGMHTHQSLWTVSYTHLRAHET